MRNKNFHSWRIGTIINIHTGRDDQKIEGVIHKIAKANNFQYVASKKYVALITIQRLLPTNRTVLSENTNSTGPAIHLKSNTELATPLK